MNDEDCDCYECEDEDNWTCDTCISGSGCNILGDNCGTDQGGSGPAEDDDDNLLPACILPSSENSADWCAGITELEGPLPPR